MRRISLARRPFTILGNEDGVAFPIALFGLIMVTIMVTALLSTSATELAVSVAHQDAQASLYTAEEGIATYLAALPTAFAPGAVVPQPTNQTVALNGGRSAEITVVRLDSLPAAGVPPGRETYLIRSRSATGGGREVGAMFQVTFSPSTLPFTTAIRAAATFGGNVQLSGSAKLFGEQTDTNRRVCNLSGVAPVNALESSGEGTFTRGGSMDTTKNNVYYKTAQSLETKQQMQDRILGGWTPRQLADKADIKFGPLYNQTAFNGSKVFPDNTRTSRYNWGCPQIMGVSCKDPADANWYPVVALDANGGRVTIANGESGQGMLIVVNGGVLFKNSFKYRGLIIAEGTIDIEGSLVVDGAVYAAGTVSVAPPDNNTNNLGGTLQVNYDQCAINSVQSAFNGNNPGPITRNWSPRETFGWFEVVR